MTELLSDAVAQITGILGKIAELTSDYNEAMRLMEGLSGALVVLTEFIERRVGDGNEVDPKAMRHLIDTLAAIEGKIDDIHETMGKRWGCVPYGKWFVYGAPMGAPCFGRAGSTKLIKQLTDLEGDLAGDIKFLELQMTANAVRSLSAISSVQMAIAKVFRNREAREFWISSFGEEFSAGQETFSDRLVSVVRKIREQHNDSDMSRASKLCAYLSADLARAGVIDVRDFSDSIGSQSIEGWIRGSVSGKARAVLAPGHFGAVTAMACSKGFLVTGGEDGTVKVFALSETGVPMHRATLVGHNDPVTCVGVCESEGIVASGSRDGFLRTWSLYGGESVACYPVSSEVRAMACGGSDIVYACAAPTMSINVRNSRTGEVVSKMYGHAGGVTSLAIDGGRGAGAPRAFSAGSDRSVKEWLLSEHEHARVVPQAHSISVRHVLMHDSFLASVSDRDVRFYDPSDISAESELTRVSERVEGGGSVCGACVMKGAGCVVLATSEPFAASANARLHAVFPSDGGSVRFTTSIRTATGEAPSSLATHNGVIYVGYTSGSVRWFSLGGDRFVEAGFMGSASQGTDPVLADVVTRPLLAGRGAGAVYAHPPDLLRFHPSGQSVPLPEPATAVSHSEAESGWVVASGKSVTVFGDDGGRRSTFEVAGSVSSLHPSTVRRKMFMDVRRKNNVRSIVVCDTASGVCTDLVCEPCLPEGSCSPGLVMNDRYLVWPGYFDGTLSVMDTVEMLSHEPVRYSHLEVDPVTDIATSATWFCTLHGGLDVLLWNDVRNGPFRCIKTFQNPVTSLMVCDGARLVSGCADGTVLVNDDAGEGGGVHVDHALGPVSLAPAERSWFYSLGVDGSLVLHALR